MKEEDTLLKKIGKDNSFKVPDGYFANLTSEVMNRLPAEETNTIAESPVSMWTKVKPLLYLAAMFVGAALIIRSFSVDNNIAESPVSMWTKVKPLLYLAAMFVGAALIIRSFSVDNKPVPSADMAMGEEETEILSEEIIDYTLDRAMLDDYSLYVYLSDSDNE